MLGILGHAGIQSMLCWMGENWVIYRGAWTESDDLTIWHVASGPGAQELTDFCFGVNKRPPGNDAFRGDCACGAAGK